MAAFLGVSLIFKLDVYGVERGHALSARFSRHEIQLNGTGDMLIAPPRETPTRTKLARAVVEVKKHTNAVWKSSQAHHQAMLELLALDQLASDIVFSVLTDLRDSWFFYRIDNSHSLKLDSLHAGVTTLRELLQADCSWNGSPQRLDLTYAAGDCIYATKFNSEPMADQAPPPAPASSDPSQFLAPATAGATSSAAATTSLRSEPPKSHPQAGAPTEQVWRILEAIRAGHASLLCYGASDARGRRWFPLCLLT